LKRLALILLALATAVSAQTVSPLNSEHNRKKVRGEFSLSNDGFAPIRVTLQPMSLTIVDGKPVVGDLALSTHVRLSEYSATVGAKQIHTFGVNASCDGDCAFIVFAAFVSGHLDNGVVVATHVGTTFYACQKQKGCRQSFLTQIKSE
jgi:hypothetical protein